MKNSMTNNFAATITYPAIRKTEKQALNKIKDFTIEFLLFQ